MATVKDQIRLIEIVEINNPPILGGAGKHLKVTLGHFDDSDNPIIQATWYLSRKEWPDDAALPLARSWLHHLSKAIADATQDWALSEEQIEKMKKKTPRQNPPLYSSTVPF